MVDEEGIGLLALVSRRSRLLAQLEDPSRKPGLTDALPASRSTVDRAVRELESRSLVERSDGGFRLTLAGHLARAEYDDLTGTLADVAAARELLSYLSPDAPLAPAFLRGAEVSYPEPPSPRRPLMELWELVESADRFRGFTTAVLEPRFVEEMYELVSEGEIRVEFVYEERIADYLREAYPDLLAETLGEGHRMYVIDSVPLGLGVLSGADGSHAYVVASDENGEFRGIAINDAPEAIEWGEDLFERYRDRATELTEP